MKRILLQINFIKISVLVILFFIGIMLAVVGCNRPMDPDCMNEGTTISIQNNHGHQLSVPVADISSGVDKTYPSIMGTADHDHSVTLTAADFLSLKNNHAIQETSTLCYPCGAYTSHSHLVTVGCAKGSSSGGGGY